MCLAQKTCSFSVLYPVVTSLGTEVPSSAFCQRWVTLFVAKRHLITLLNTLYSVNTRPWQVVKGAVLSALKVTRLFREKPQSTLWKVFSSALILKPLPPFFIHGDFLSNSCGTRGHLHPSTKQGSVWDVCDPVPRTYIFCCLFSSFSFTVFKPNLLINKEVFSVHTHPHPSLNGNINNSRGHHWGFDDFFEFSSLMGVGSLERNLLSTSQGWIPNS